MELFPFSLAFHLKFYYFGWVFINVKQPHWGDGSAPAVECLYNLPYRVSGGETECERGFSLDR